MEPWLVSIPQAVKDRYEVMNYNHAVEIMTQAYRTEFDEILASLQAFVLHKQDLVTQGGNESSIPKQFSSLLRPLDWQEMKVTGDLLVKLHGCSSVTITEHLVENFIDGHNIDYIKGSIAIDIEWNSKDQTFDRDLFAFRTLYECGIIACGVIITRSESLNTVFRRMNIMGKYGASTTWIGKLTPRLSARRHGGCPILVVGITPHCIADWSDDDNA